jgi:hypothetical protein
LLWLRQLMGHTPLHFACLENHASIVELMLSYRLSAVQTSERAGLSADARLIGRRIDSAMNALSESYMTPLHIAVQRDNVRIVKLLCDAGADPNEPNVRQAKKGALRCAKAHCRCRRGVFVCTCVRVRVKMGVCVARLEVRRRFSPPLPAAAWQPLWSCCVATASDRT